MNIFAFLLVGLCSGFLAGKIVEGHGFGTFGDIVVGFLGAVVGGLVFTNSGFQNGSFTGAVATSTVGAVIFLLVAGFCRGERQSQKV